VPARKIDDAQPAHADATAAIYVDSIVIRTAVPNQIAHGPYCGGFRYAVPK
jgi:hypothetical protein